MNLINYFYYLFALFSLNLIQTSKVAAFKKSDHRQIKVFSKNHVISKRILFSRVFFYDGHPTLTFEQFKRIYESVAEQMRKEKEMK
jgi:hypothetical protein